MNNIEILELLSRKIEEQNSIIASCSYIENKKAEAKKRTEYIEIKKFVENLIKENKKLKKQMGKDLDVVYIKGVYDERDKWKSKVKEKIKEYQEIVEDFEKYWSKDPRQFKKEKCTDYYKIEVLQELLEGE